MQQALLLPNFASFGVPKRTESSPQYKRGNCKRTNVKKLLFREGVQSSCSESRQTGLQQAPAAFLPFQTNEIADVRLGPQFPIQAHLLSSPPKKHLLSLSSVPRLADPELKTPPDDGVPTLSS